MKHDRGATTAVQGLHDALLETDRCHIVAMERIVEACHEIDALSGWAGDFERRYIDLDLVSH